jgi:hypothetical protein
MAAERRSDPKRSQSARVATAARRQAIAARNIERAQPRSLESLAREMGVPFTA